MPHVFQIIFHEGREEYVAGVLLLIQKRPFVLLGLALRLEPPFARMPAFPGPVRVVEGGISHCLAIFEGIFVGRHGVPPYPL